MKLGRGNTEVDPVLRAAVEAVRDPELHRPLGELGMIARIERRGRRVIVAVALTTEACPLREQIVRDVSSAVTGVDPDAQVDVTLSVMSEQRRAELGALAIDRPPSGTPAREVYAVGSGKGGVGKSSVAANLAVALARSGRRVGLLDADVWGYSIPQLFGVSRRPIVLNGHMLPIEAHGVALMSIGFFVDTDEPVVWRGPMLHKAMTQFVSDVHWGELDTLIVDLPPGTGDVTISVLELLPDAALVAVTTPQPAAARVASRMAAMARDARMPLAGVIENMSELVCAHCAGRTSLFGSGGGAALAAELGCPLLGQIPLDIALREAGDEGRPVVASETEGPAAAEFSRIASRLRVPARGLVGRDLGLVAIR